MFGRMMNNFYYGKSGKGDFKKDDLPKNRMQLFFEMLRIRFSALFRLNLMTIAVYIPLIYFVAVTVSYFLQGIMTQANLQQIVEQAGVTLQQDMAREEYVRLATESLTAAEVSADEINFFFAFDLRDFTATLLFRLVIYLIPCIAITGPVETGLAYVTRNWSRDEHAFIWSDFKDAVKANWKQGLGVSVITSLIPITVYICWNFYSSMATSQGGFFIVPQMLVVVLAIIWVLGTIYMYPMIVTYDVKFGTLIRNSVMLGIGRLPQNVGIRLLSLIPAMIAAALLLTTSIGMYALMVLLLYYVLIGNALDRFVIASWTNAVFDRFINAHMEGVQINRGLSTDEDEEDEEDGDSASPEA